MPGRRAFPAGSAPRHHYYYYHYYCYHYYCYHYYYHHYYKYNPSVDPKQPLLTV